MYSSSPLSPADRLAVIVRAMVESVVGRSSVLPYILMTTICMRLSGVVRRFRSLALRVAAGKVRPSRPRGARVAPADAPRRPRAVPVVETVPLPRGFAWLLPLVPGAVNFGSQLVHLLEDPEVAALVASSPGFGRMLRPMCRMLAVSPLPEILKPPPPVRHAKQAPEQAAEPEELSAPAALPPMRPIYPRNTVLRGVETWSRRSRGGFSSA